LIFYKKIKLYQVIKTDTRYKETMNSKQNSLGLGFMVAVGELKTV